MNIKDNKYGENIICFIEERCEFLKLHQLKNI
jgi:hypothetical protein